MRGNDVTPDYSGCLHMLRRCIVLFIVIRPLDGALSLVVHLVLINRNRLHAGTGLQLLPSLHHHHHPHTTHTTKLLHIQSPNLNLFQHTIQIHISHVLWSVQAVHELKIDHTQHHLSALHGTRSTY